MSLSSLCLPSEIDEYLRDIYPTSLVHALY